MLDTTSEEVTAVPVSSVSTNVQKLTNRSLLARNAVWNLIGQMAPMAVGVAVIPRLIHVLGTDRFGVLTIAWMVVGYFGFLDLGLGRALTNLVAQKLGENQEAELPGIIWTANLLMAGLGIIGVIVFVLLSPMLVLHALKTPPAMQLETISAFYVLSLSVPLVISTTGFRAILEARQQFRLVNIVRIPMGIATFLAPVIILPWYRSLTAVVGTLVAARLFFWGTYVYLALRDMPVLRRNIVIHKNLVPKLFTFGAWMTLSNVISPLMGYLDRFLIGMLLSLTAVAYYATPYEVATKLLIVPAAIVGVLFPAFSTALMADRGHAGMLFRRAVQFLILSLFPLALLIVLFAQSGLTIWLGATFASHSTTVLRWLSVGVFANSLAYLPYTLLQGAGRPDLTGKLHLVELPFYVALVWVLTKHFGIEGTAIAWTIRVVVDGALLFWLADGFLNKTLRLQSLALTAAAIAGVFAVAMLGISVPIKIVVSVVALIAFCAIVWLVLLTAQERGILLKRVTRFRLSSGVALE